nr:NusG domain II-containing protein [Eubacterium sp.]
MKVLHKSDLITITILFFIGFVASLLIYMPSKTNGSFVEVRVNGVVTERYALSQPRTETVHTENGSNTFYIKDGKVTMQHADCHDQVCVSMTHISRQGQTIVCLPHKLVLAITNGDTKEPAYDAVTGGAS